jgi:hypothetical protein
MTTTTSTQEIDEQPLTAESIPQHSGRRTSSPLDRALQSVGAFWRDQVYLNERLLVAQRPWDDASDPR